MPFVTVGPNEVLVVAGCCLGKPLKISKGGRKFILSGLQTYKKLSLNVHTIKVVSPRIYTCLGVPITVTGVAQVKVESQVEEMLTSACEQFLSMKTHDIIEMIRQTLEAHQRAIMGIMTIEEIYQDRKKFSTEVFRTASHDLSKMGLSVVSYTIKDITDEEGYLIALGQKRIAQVKSNARIGEAEAKRDAGICTAVCDRDREKAAKENDTLIAEAQRNFLLKKASFDKEVKTKEAIAQRAYELQAAIVKQSLTEAKRQIDVIEREAKIKVCELDVQRKEKELEASICKSAEAEKYRIETLAKVDRIKQIKEAEAASERIKLLGEANAFAIESMGQAEAEQMSLKAEAWSQYQTAAKTDMVLNMLPQLAAEIAQPIACSCQKITMVANGESAEIGISKMMGEMVGVMQSLYTSVGSMGKGDSIALGSGGQRHVS